MTDEIYVLDSCAVIAFFQGEKGAEVVKEVLAMPQHRCLMHVINVCEVYYDIVRRSGLQNAAALPSLLRSSGIELISALPSKLWQLAGNIKAEWRRVSLADCFALALAHQHKAILLTSDHHEFDRLASEFSLRFIR